MLSKEMTDLSAFLCILIKVTIEEERKRVVRGLNFVVFLGRSCKTSVCFLYRQGVSVGVYTQNKAIWEVPTLIIPILVQVQQEKYTNVVTKKW